MRHLNRGFLPSVYFMEEIKVPCGSLVPSEHKDSVLDYTEYAVYDPQQVYILQGIILFLNL